MSDLNALHALTIVKVCSLSYILQISGVASAHPGCVESWGMSETETWASFGEPKSFKKWRISNVSKNSRYNVLRLGSWLAFSRSPSILKAGVLVRCQCRNCPHPRKYRLTHGSNLLTLDFPKKLDTLLVHIRRRRDRYYTTHAETSRWVG